MFCSGTLTWTVQKVGTSVSNGAVTLTGTVGTYWEKYLAEDDAYRIGSISDVTNELAIVLDGTWSDEQITKVKSFIFDPIILPS